ncbi:MAG: hypothetical protein AAGA76_12675 [Pseudomonadota bacterium]
MATVLALTSHVICAQSLNHGGQLVDGDTMYLTEMYENEDLLIFSDNTSYLEDQLGLTVGKAMVFAENVPTAVGGLTDLKVEWFLPSPKLAKDDKHRKRPMFVWLPAGALADDANSEKAAIATEFAMNFARRGFVTLVVKYQFPPGALLRDRGVGNCRINLREMKKALYRVALNARTAIRFAGAFADTLAIDLSNIIVGGRSVGAVAAMGTAFLDSNEQHQWLVDSVGSLTAIAPRVVPGLGHLPIREQDYQIKGMFAKSGGLTNPGYLNHNNIPCLMLHGTCDDLIPFDKGWPKDCNQPQTPPGMAQNPEDAFKFYGPWFIADHFDKLAAETGKNVYYEVGVSCGVGHSFPGPSQEFANNLLFRYIDPFLYKVVSNGHLNAAPKRYKMEYPDDLVSDGSRCKVPDFNVPLCSMDTLINSIAPSHTPLKATLYPNPAKDHFFVTCPGASCGSGIQVQDVTGQAIRVRATPTNAHAWRVEFMENVSAGIYFVSNDQGVLARLVVQE